MARAGTKLEYYSDSGTWTTEDRLISFNYEDAIRGRSRVVNILLHNRNDDRETRYQDYRKVRLTYWKTSTKIFSGRVEDVEPLWDSDYGRCVKLICRDYMSELIDRPVDSDYSGTARKRSALVSQIVDDYSFSGVLSKSIEESGSDETVELDFSDSNQRASAIIGALAKEDPWTDEDWGTEGAVWRWDNSASSWVDDTTEADSSAGTPFSLIDATADYRYFGSNNPFIGIYFDLDTNGSYGTQTWEYWNGSAWSSLTLIQSYDFTSNGIIKWEVPLDWAAKAFSGTDPHGGTPPDTTSRYWVRVSVSSITTDATVNYATIEQGFGYNYYTDGTTFYYERAGSSPSGGPSSNGLTLELRGTAGDQKLPFFYDYSFPQAVKERYTRVTVKGKDSDGAAVSYTESDSNAESNLEIVKEFIDEIYGVTNLAYCQTRAKALLTLLNGNILRGRVSINGFPRYTVGGTNYTVRAGDLVRVKCSPRSVDDDFVVLKISYKEPEGVATLEMIEKTYGWGFSPLEFESIISGIYHEQGKISARVGDIPDTPSTPSAWSASNITPAVGQNADGTSYIYFIVEIPRVNDAQTYELQYRVKNASNWELLTVAQPGSGNPIVKTPPVKDGETYEFRCRSKTLAGVYSDWSSIVEKTAISDTTAPSAPTGLTATGSFRTIFLDWTNPTDADWKHTEVWASSTNDRSAASLVAKISADYFAHTGLNTGVTRYYWIRAADASGNQSGWEPSGSTNGVSATTIKAGTTDIDDFAIDASKLWTKVPVLESDSWGDDDPSSGYVSWNAHNLYYDGVKYSISSGNTSQKYIYWVKPNTSYSTSNTNPSSSTLGDDGFVIATNVGGAHDLAWNAIANQIIGNAYIESLNADKIQAGDIATARITANAANAVNDNDSVSIEADRINISGQTTFASGYDPSEKVGDIIEFLASDASSGQKDVVLESSAAASRYDVGDVIELRDDSNSETCEIASISSATLTMTENLTNSYTVAANAKVTLFGAADNINNGVTTIDGGKITTGTITADKMNVSQLSAITADIGLLTAGEIRLGSGTVGTDFTGLRFYESGTTYRMAGYNSDVLQAYFDSNGELKAGGGDVVLDENGAAIYGEFMYFYDPNNDQRGKLFGRESGSGFYGFNIQVTGPLTISASESVSIESGSYYDIAIYAVQDLTLETSTANNGDVILDPDSEDVLPGVSGDTDLGNSSDYWGTVCYKTLSDEGCPLPAVSALDSIRRMRTRTRKLNIEDVERERMGSRARMRVAGNPGGDFEEWDLNSFPTELLNIPTEEDKQKARDSYQRRLRRYEQHKKGRPPGEPREAKTGIVTNELLYTVIKSVQQLADKIDELEERL